MSLDCRRPLRTLFVFVLALVSATPEIQWCRLAWADVSPECFAACTTPGPCSTSPDGTPIGPSCTMVPCGSAEPSSTPPLQHEPACVDVTGGAPSCDLFPATSDETLPEDRAWYPGDVPAGAAPPESGFHASALAPAALIAPEIELDSGTTRWTGVALLAVAIPIHRCAHAPPQIRAPPIA